MSLDIIVLITGDWDNFHRKLLINGIYENISDEDRILIINRPIDFFYTPFKHREKLKKYHLNKVYSIDKKTTLITPTIFIHDQVAYKIKFLEEINLFFLKKQLKKLLRKDSRKVLWCMHPSFFNYTTLYKFDYIVYDCYDDFTDMPNRETDKHLQKIEEKMLNESNYSFTPSKYLSNKKNSEYNVDKFKVISNSTSYKLFKDAFNQVIEPASDILNIPKPIIGYVGRIKAFIDQDLILFLANKFPHYSFVFLGEVKDEYIIKLKDLKNVFFLGKKHYEQLPYYTVHFDLGIIPYILNKDTIVLNPNKAYEYLMSGLEVVSVPIPELIGKFPDYIHIAKNKEEMAVLLVSIINRPKNKLEEEKLIDLSWTGQLRELFKEIKIISEN